MSPPDKDPLALQSQKSDANAPAAEHEPSLPPPPYQPADSTDALPGYTPSGLASDDSTIHAATAKIPPTLNGYYQWKWTRTMLLGPTAEETLYAVSTNSRMFSSKQSIVLHDGPSDQHPVVASLESDVMGRRRPFIITIPSRSETTPDTVVEVHGSLDHRSSMAPPFSFSCVVGEGKGTLREAFEWRRSHGKEVHELARLSSGWKLVRMSQISESDAAGGSRARRERGFTSDGREVVAVLAHNSSLSLTKGFRFAFMGSGRLGTLGGNWEMAALISAVQVFNIDMSMVSTAGAAS